MYCKLAFAALAVLIGNDFVSAQQQIPPTTTAAELWNPWTWFWPYAIATAEGYRDYYEKAQKATNELYQQIYKTNAFPWVTGNWGLPQTNQNNGQNNQNNQGGDKGQNNQNNQGGDNGQNNQNNPTGDNGQNNQNNPTGDNGQNNQNNPTGDNGQNNQNDGKEGQNNQDNANEQNKPTEENEQTNQDNGSEGQNNPDDGKEDPATDESNQDKTGPSAQVEGGAQSDGNVEAEVNGEV